MTEPKPRRRRSGAAKGGPLPDVLKARLAKALPGLFDAALQAYRRIAEVEPEADAKSSAAAHSAAKAALAHLELLLKLADLIAPAPAEASAKPGRKSADFGRDRLIAAARLALRDSDFADDGGDDPDDPERG